MLSEDKPTVLIVGAGLGGLMLATLLEKSGVPYTVFERATAVKPLGSALAIGPTLLPLFQQLGFYDEFVAIGKYLADMSDYKETSQGLSPLPLMDMRPVEGLGGYPYYIVSRPALYELILKQVPAHKIRFGCRVLNTTEEDDKVIVHVSNGDTFEGDIVVGADGAYSAVRQRMYEEMKAKGVLPISDQEELPFSTTCLVGQTDVLDPKEFTEVALNDCHFTATHGEDKPFSWHTFNTAEGKICFMVLHHLDSKTTKAATEQRFRENNNAEWGGHPAQTMCDETRSFPVPIRGGKIHTLGDLFDLTPKECISKVMLEEKVFETWHYRRCVLLGDACHKLNPAGGHGAMAAMHDAIALANLLYAMPTKTSSDITKIFEEYREERFIAAMGSYKYSKQMAMKAEKSVVGALYSYCMTHMPKWLWKFTLSTALRHRPQAGFLTPIEVRGTVVPVISPSEQKARALFKKQQLSAAAV